MTRALRVLAPLLLLAVPLAAQLAPPSAGGLEAYAHETVMLGHNIRVLMIGAHPDDEDTELLAYLSRGLGAEAAYLALNRGEGGQNLIGPELGEALGLLRTEELLSARRVDGARQYFTRAYDFGFSKTLDDTWAHWPRDSVLKDVVRIIRRFRPQVVVTVFTGTPRDGHGQHQAAGWAARAAFEVAGDSSRFPELAREEGLPAWTPLKLYQSTRFDTARTTLALEGGRLDRATGLTFHQIAMASRSRHRSQDMGQLQRLGPSSIRLALVTDRTGRGTGGLLAGIDTTLTPVLGREAAARYSVLVGTIRGGADSARPRAFAQAARLLAHAPVPTEPAIADQARHLTRARAMASDLAVDALAADDHLVPGQSVVVTTMAANAADHAIEVADSVAIPPGWGESDRSRPLGAVAPNALATRSWRLAVPDTAEPSTPYFLRQPRNGDLYRWPASAQAWWGEPFEPPRLRAEFSQPGDPVPVPHEVTERTNDQALGEVRTPVITVPALDVRIDRDTVLLPAGAEHRLGVVISLANDTPGPVDGELTLEVPAGWPEPPARHFAFTSEDERDNFPFTITVPARADTGRYLVRAVAMTRGGRRYSDGMRALHYEHVRPRAWVAPATVSVELADLALPRLARIGYVRGAADRVPEVLAAAGLPISLLTASDLESGDLSGYDAIVVGPRAYEVDSALVQHNRRLLDYVDAGGLLLVQYQQYQFIRGQFAPKPLTIASPHDRVTDEHAAVTLLDPASPAVREPNRIGPRDWEGWIQERGLYFAHTWDDAYHPLLAMHDAGEAPLEGSLLVASVGKGTYVYTGLSFFRELPAGVPGAFRLFANLLALRSRPVP